MMFFGRWVDVDFLRWNRVEILCVRLVAKKPLGSGITFERVLHCFFSLR
jgi:hypothetical protein